MKKIITYILIFAVLVGFFSPLAQVQADTTYGTCRFQAEMDSSTPPKVIMTAYTAQNEPSTQCAGGAGSPSNSVFTPYPDGKQIQGVSIGGCLASDTECINHVVGTPGSTSTVACNGTTDVNTGAPLPQGCNPNLASPTLAAQQAAPESSPLENHLQDCANLVSGSFTGCIEHFFYVIAVTLPSSLLAIIASMFDFVVAISISSHMYGLPFIQTIWGIVRDFGNIFFILILLYAAFQIILGLNEHGGKKIIGMVIIVALLVNFSLFLTKVVIDSSNIMALIFYNRIDVSNAPVAPISDATKTGVNEKGISAALVSSFNINKFYSEDFLNKLVVPATQIGNTSNIVTGLGTGCVAGAIGTGGIGCPAGAVIGAAVGFLFPSVNQQISVYLLIGMMTVYGLVVYALVYAFFIGALSFIGRMINLMMLMMVSPFAFVTAAVPQFKHIDTIGFDSWIKKLLESSFVAAIFIFIIYIISQILSAHIFDGVANPNNANGTIQDIITLFLPAILIVVLLTRGAKYAKRASGEFTEKIIKGTEVLGALAVGGTIGATAAGLQGTAGHLGKKIFESKSLTNWETDQKSGFKRFVGKNLRTLGGGDDGKGGMAGSSFDLRRGIVGEGLKLASTATGFNLGTNSKFLMREGGGYEADLKRRDEKRKKRAEGLKIKEGEPEKQKLNEYEEDHQKVALQNENDIHHVELQIAGAKTMRDTLRDKAKASEGTSEHAANQQAFLNISKEVENLEQKRRDLKNGGLNEETGEYRTNNGKISKVMVANMGRAAEKAATEQAAADGAATAAITAHDTAKIAEEAATAAVATATTDKAAAEAAAATDPTNILLATKATEAAANEKAAAEALSKATANVATAAANIGTTATKATEAADKATTAREAADRANNLARNGTGYSQNDYEDHLLPTQKLKVSEVTKGRQRLLANNIAKQSWQFWNKAARMKSAHEIRMGAKVEKSHGGGHDKTASFGSELLAGAITETVFGGHHGGGDHGTAAAPAAGGGNPH